MLSEINKSRKLMGLSEGLINVTPKKTSGVNSWRNYELIVDFLNKELNRKFNISYYDDDVDEDGLSSVRVDLSPRNDSENDDTYFTLSQQRRNELKTPEDIIATYINGGEFIKDIVFSLKDGWVKKLDAWMQKQMDNYDENNYGYN